MTTATQPSGSSGTLYVVSTPIGNLEDITLRALRVLRGVETILAEDTRHTRKLCTHFEISARLESVHDHTDQAKLRAIVTRMIDGESFALVSDAGAPLVSDPGGALVRLAVEANCHVEAIPGPSAVVTALTSSGIPFHGFVFDGFLPRSGKHRTAALHAISERTYATVFFESPNRIVATLHEITQVLADEREVAVCRELTKQHEEIVRGSAADVISRLGEHVRGEITVVIQGRVESKSDDADVSDAEVIKLIERWIDAGLRHKEIANELQTATSWTKKRAYDAVTVRLKLRAAGTSEPT